MYRLPQARAFQKPRLGLRNATAPAGKCVGLRLEGFGKQPRWAWFRGDRHHGYGRRIGGYSDTSGSYLSASSPVLPFGLGAEGGTGD